MDQMIQIDEGRMKDIFTADEEGKSAKEIAKALKLPLGTVKKILGEDNDLQEFSDSQLDVLARQYAGLKGKTISVDNANKLRQIFKRIPDSAMDALRKKKIPFLSGLALSRMVQKGMPVKEDKEEPKLEPGKDGKIGPAGKIALAKEKDTDNLEAQLTTAKGQIELLKTKLENEKNKAVKPEPNKETGEVPLTVGVAHKYLKDKAEKEKEEKKDVKEAFKVKISHKDGGSLIAPGTYKTKADAEKFIKWYKTGDTRNTKSIEVVKEMAKDKAYAIGMATAKKKYNDEPPLDKKTIKKAHEIGDKLSKMKKENKDHPAREVYEQIKGLKNKAEKSGMPYGILKKVYDRGMAAWRGGHRPGTTQQQWAFARVNSFVTKSSGTWGGADKDLAAKVKGN